MLFRTILAKSAIHTKTWRRTIDTYFHDATLGWRVPPVATQAQKDTEASQLQNHALLITVILKICASLDVSNKIGCADVLFEGASIELRSFSNSQRARFSSLSGIHSRTAVQISRAQPKLTARNQARCLAEWQRGGLNLHSILKPKTIQEHFSRSGHETIFGVVPSSVVQFARTSSDVSKSLIPRAHLILRNVLRFLLRKLENSMSIHQDSLMRELISSTLETIRSVCYPGARHEVCDDALIAM